jgi:flagellar biosynthesis protein FlhG
MAIDATLKWSDLNAFFDLQPVYSLDEFFSGAASLDEIIVSPGDGTYLLPGSATKIKQLSDAQKLALLTELDELSHELDLVLVETASGVSDSVSYFASAAQEIVVVITPEPATVAGAYVLIEALASTQREKRFRILANQVADGAEALRLFDRVSAPALRFLNASLDLIGWIPYDNELASCSARVQPVVLAAAQAPSATAIDVLADKLIASTPPRVKGSLQFFFRRILEQSRGRL